MAAVDSHQHPHVHHHHEPAHDGDRGLGWAVVITLAFAMVEWVTGLLSGSLALLSDAGHMLTDSLSLVFAALAARLAQRPPSAQHSYGLARAEVLAALLNALIMLGIVAWIVSEAFARLSAPRAVAGEAVAGVALLGLLVNLAVAWMLTRGTATLNKRAALLHVMGDALGSLAALAAGLVIVVTGWTPIDPILSVAVALLILVSTLSLLRETIHVLMEGVPSHIDMTRVGRRLAELDGVARVHDLHIWTLSSGQVAISAHFNVRTLDHWPRILAEARETLQREFGIGHVTLQPELLEALTVAFPKRHESKPG
jgi:cobalt-zinc-cadmium efflux system protein